jgi:hypothetical protein
VHTTRNEIVLTRGARGDNLISNVLLANLLQLLLSFMYYAYNLFTMLCVEKEWSSYSLEYRPVRVTDPVGQQISTYRLQLPYRYSVGVTWIDIITYPSVSRQLVDRLADALAC